MKRRLCFPILGGVMWLLCCSLVSVQGGKVLVLPVDGSHWLSMKILVEELSHRGHEVLVLVPENSLLMKGSQNYKTEIYQDLQEFVDGSGDDGFIVFTLGSMVPNMPEKMTKQFFDAFHQIPQRVVWRYTEVRPGDTPKNVKLMKWLPQNDLLAHPKAKVFITHGGNHGIYESICNAVPMLMFPLFGDQRHNAQRMVSRGVAEKLSIYDVTTEKLLASLNKITHDQSYKEKMVELSQKHLDRPVEPLDLAVFWTEFVMRHKGAAHLRAAAHELNWVQYHSLDVLGFLFIILLTVLWLTTKCCLFCKHKCFRENITKKKRE
ncbi:UDP-glucuronosyltransferase-like isoform X2 [Antennarius striatus]|uniref:UDP-glucuronosyltransferase-like isoform X2 n=1 Tax=Antennarius striatus TaxID=241820 RepID=UPI0035B370C3